LWYIINFIDFFGVQMSIHRKAVNRIITLRTALIKLKVEARSVAYRQAIDSLVADAERMITQADDMLLHPRATDRDLVNPPVERTSYEFDEMPVGGAFVVDAAKIDSLRSAASQYARRHGKRFSVQLQPGGGKATCTRIS
jgi:hypothetical protein